MINPNATCTRYGYVTKLSRSRCDGSLNVTVTLSDGSQIEELGFLYDDSLRSGDTVKIDVGFSITSDRFGIKGIKRVTASRVTGRLVEAVVRVAYRNGARCQWSEQQHKFIVNGAPVDVRRVFAFLDHAVVFAQTQGGAR